MKHDPQALRHSSICRQLALLARGEICSQQLTEAYLDAAEAENAHSRAYVSIDRAGALRAAKASDERRDGGRALGRLDGIPLAIKDSLDVQGLVTSAGLAGRSKRVALRDAAVITRLRGAGAVILGKTSLDEGSLGAMGRTAHQGDVPNPRHPGKVAGGSSAGSAAAVALGLASAAIGSDTMGSVRIPAAFCGVFGLRPTMGEVSSAGLWPCLPRLDSAGPLTRSMDDLTLLLQTLSGYDPNDPRTRQRRVPLATPDWEPGRLRSGVAQDLGRLGASAAVQKAFDQALAAAAPALGQTQPVLLADFELGRARRAALLMMEAGMALSDPEDLDDCSQRLRDMLDFARQKSAVDYARAERRLDEAVVATRRLFDSIDVLLLPTTPDLPPAIDSEEPANLADFTAFASLAGCPALSIPLDGGAGLQLVGPRGSDLRLLELGEIVYSLIG